MMACEGQEDAEGLEPHELCGKAERAVTVSFLELGKLRATVSVKYLVAGIKKMETNSCQWCHVKEEEGWAQMKMEKTSF